MDQIVVLDKTSIRVYELESPEILGWPEIIEGTKEYCLWEIVSRKSGSLVIEDQSEINLSKHVLTLVAFTY